MDEEEAGIERCGVLLECGQDCCGYRDEDVHLGCMSCGAHPLRYQNRDEDCVICLERLSLKACVQLGCGHAFHLGCVRQQLKRATPDPSKRLIFNGFQCSYCGVICEHPALEGVVRSTSSLRAKVVELVKGRVELEGLTQEPAVTTPGSPYFGNPVEYGLHVLAFYLCSICEEPFFGGTVDCADREREEVPVSERMCPTCDSRGSIVCRDGSHAGSYVWKCRYCCSFADFVCFGTTHLCTRCHGRETKTPIPCQGRGRCQLPMREGVDVHSNGHDSSNEELLHCRICQSSPDTSEDPDLIDRGSPNMVFNPCGEAGLQGWVLGGGHPSWEVETTEFPIFNIRTNFVSSFTWCGMYQVVDLSRFLREPGRARLEVSARFMARQDCPSSLRMCALVLDGEAACLASYDSGVRPAPQDYWDRLVHIFEPQPRTHFILLAFFGKDSRFWAGHYGSKVTLISVRMLYDGEDTDERAFDIVALQNAEEDTTPESRSIIHRWARRIPSGPLRSWQVR